MRPIKNINAVSIISLVILLGIPVSAHADWSNAGMHPGMTPNLNLNQSHAVHVNITPPARVAPQHRLEPVPVRHAPITPGYFRRDADYYGHDRVIFPYSDVDLSFVVPDGFEVVMVNGEMLYYNQGVFYQQVDGQLVVIPAVLGAVVDSIPEDYQIVMADGVHYLFTGGVYYQRVDQGFEVVEPPVTQDS